MKDLENRVAVYARKLEEAAVPPTRSRLAAPERDTPTAVEILVCRGCGRSFERIRARGRKPTQCDDCRYRG